MINPHLQNKIVLITGANNPQQQYQSDILQTLLALLENEEFKTAVAAMPGYHIETMGKTRLMGTFKVPTS